MREEIQAGSLGYVFYSVWSGSTTVVPSLPLSTVRKGLSILRVPYKGDAIIRVLEKLVNISLEKDVYPVKKLLGTISNHLKENKIIKSLLSITHTPFVTSCTNLI